ncbi:MAG TPA: MgtC/SapB family protein, partial [Paracoccaceae bacterium]|nr:MgtC/SapB family protein [Paracoccaceae bacterium]
METASILFRLGLALAIGLLVGIERHWRERAEAPGTRTAGIRTFGVTGLLGGVSAALAQQFGAPGLGQGLLVGLVFLGFTAVFGLFKWRESAEQGTFSVTTVVVSQATFLLGSFAVLGEPQAAAAAAIAMTFLLASREVLHGFVARLEWAELRSAILLLAMAFVVLPILPDRPVGPLGAINPAQVWIFAIVLAGVSYAGYLAVKLFGAARGPLIAGIAGGLASSTAVAL